MSDTTKPKRTGRKTKANDPEMLQRLEQALRSGATRKSCAIYAGISETSFYAYLERAEADAEKGKTTPNTEFAEVVTRAEARAEINAAAILTGAFEKDWRAAAHFLERRKPEHWGRSDQTTIKHTGEIKQSIPDLPETPARMAEVAAVLRDAGVIEEE